MQKIPDPPPPPKPKRSKDWAIRLVENLSASIAFAAGYYAKFEIVDLTHLRGMIYKMKLAGASLGGMPIPIPKVTMGASAALGEWKYVHTENNLEFKDFEGDVVHFGVSLIVRYGWSSDRFYFFGPKSKIDHSVAVVYPMAYSKSWSASFGLDWEFVGHLTRYHGAYDMPKDLNSLPPTEDILFDSPTTPTDE
jgi:hypothetical protein